MDREAKLCDILEQWERAIQADDPASLEQLCADCPELLQEAKRRAEALEFVNDMGGLDPAKTDTHIVGRFSGETPRSLDRSGSLIDDIPSRIGPYKILEVLGEGGCGVVYLAERHRPIRRLVALKIIKPGMDSKQIVARFEAERQALAMMNHPNIAQVYDADVTDQGRPYFVMEYVRGLPITRYCERYRLTLTTRIQLFLQVCSAVQHAHQKGVIHRDLKPSNILVYSQDDQPLPKVIDFGVAKAISQPLTERTLHTLQGQVIGTLEYMSPEQLDASESDIDTRTDIYALGIVLYELLTGLLPFESADLRERGLQHAQRILRDQQPRTPSLRIADHTPSSLEASERQPAPTAVLQRALRGDLDWITLKAIRKERSERYASAAELAADLERHLADEPVLAGPPSRVYRLRKFVRKHRLPVMTSLIAGVIVLVTVAVAFTLTTLAMLRSQRAARDAQQALYANQLTTAQDEYERGNIRRVRELLTLTPPQLRAWEWRRLQYLSDQSIATFRAHQGAVTALAISPDARVIATASTASGVVLRSLDHSRPPAALQPTALGDIHTMRFTKDNLRLVVCAAAGVFVWDITTAKLVQNITLAMTRPVTLTPDAQRLAFKTILGNIRVLDLTDNSPPVQLPGTHESCSALDFTSDGDTLVIADRSGHITLWHTDTRKTEPWLKMDKPITRITLSADDRRLAVADEGGVIHLFEFNDKKPGPTLRGHAAAVHALSFSRDSARLASGDDDNLLTLWNTSSGQSIATLRGHEAPIRQIAFVDPQSRLVSASDDHTVKLWNVMTDDPDIHIANTVSPIDLACLQPGGPRFIWGYANRGINLFDVATARPITTFGVRNYGTPPLYAAWSWDGVRLAVRAQQPGVVQDTILIIDAATGVTLTTLPPQTALISALAWSPDNQHLASAHRHGPIHIWDLTSYRVINSLTGHDQPITCLAYDSVGGRLAAGAANGAIFIWRPHRPHHPDRLEGHNSAVTALAFSPDGQRLASTGPDHTLKLWIPDRPQALISFHAAGPTIVSITFDPQGQTILSADIHGTITRWITQRETDPP